MAHEDAMKEAVAAAQQEASEIQKRAMTSRSRSREQCQQLGKLSKENNALKEKVYLATSDDDDPHRKEPKRRNKVSATVDLVRRFPPCIQLLGVDLSAPNGSMFFLFFNTLERTLCFAGRSIGGNPLPIKVIFVSIFW